MKIGVFGRKVTIFFAVAVGFCLSSYSQVPGAGGPTGMSAALTDLFGKTTAFTAKGEMRVTDNSKNEISDWPMDFSVLDRKIRVEIDLAQTRNKGVPAAMGAMLKQMGMSLVVSIIRPDKGLVYVIYPDQRAMLSMPLPKEDSEGGKTPKIQKTELGKETIDGHPCTKYKVLITDPNGQTTEATTWNASDLQDLPIQIETREPDTTSVLHFKQVQFARPAPSSFEAPSDFTLYDNAEELKLSVMKKVVNSAKKDGANK